MVRYLLLLVICTPLLAQEVDFDKLFGTKGERSGSQILDSNAISDRELHEAREKVPGQFSQSIIGGAVESMFSMEGGTDEAECFSIESENLRNHCLAVVTRNEKKCFSVAGMNLRYHCIAVVNRNERECFSVESERLRYHCIATVNRDERGCFSVANERSRYHCIATVNRDKRGCFSVDDDDLRYHCLATYDWN